MISNPINNCQRQEPEICGEYILKKLLFYLDNVNMSGEKKLLCSISGEEKFFFSLNEMWEWKLSPQYSASILYLYLEEES